MRAWALLPWSKATIAILAMLAPVMDANAVADPSLAYETVEPSRITMGSTATIRVTSLDGYLQDVRLPTVPGLTFEMIGRSQGLEFVNGKSIPAWYVLIRVTPQFLGVFTIPGLTPKSPTVGLEVVTADAPNPYAWRSQKPTAQPAPMSKAPIPKGIQLKANGAAFVRLVVPTRAVYLGENVPVDIELGIRPGIVTSLNGPPALSSADFTLNNLSKQPLRREQVIDGNPFLIMTWHSAVAAVKPGEFSLSVETPLSVRVDTRSAEDQAFAARLGWPFSQITYKGAAPKDVTVGSPSSELKVLPLPTQGRPSDFSGAVGDFQVSSDVSPNHVAAGDPLTLRFHISGAGNFDRVYAPMFDRLDHWKTYPAKSSFTAKDESGTRGEKVFEQPLIASGAGERSIPALEFSYFNPNTRQYERARTQPINVRVGTSLADSSLAAPAEAGNATSPSLQGLRPDHPRSQSSVSHLRPLYFQAPFLAVPAALALLLAGSWLVVRPPQARATSRAAERALARLEAAARSGDFTSFFEGARNVLLQTFAARWRMAPDQITSTELRSRLGAAGEDVERLFALADEARYSDYAPGSTDFARWLGLVRGQLAGGRE